MTSPVTAQADGLAKTRYDKLNQNREPYLRRARAASALTLPALYPPDGHTPTSQLPTPYQSFGARAVNNLSARLILTLFPANAPFFRYSISDFELEKATQDTALRGEIEEAFSRVERAIITDIETSAYRGVMTEAAKHLLVAGNFLMYWPDTGRPRLYPLTSYVVLRSPSGRVMEIVVREELAWAELEQSVLDQLIAAQVPNAAINAEDVSKTVEVYTHIRYAQGRVIWHQEIENIAIKGSISNVPEDRNPWMAIRLMEEVGSAYSRSYVEDYIGDFKSLEALREAIVNGSLAAAWLVFLLNPGSILTPDDLRDAPSGTVLYGMKDDLSAVQLEKIPDLAFVAQVADKIEAGLSYAFLLNSAIQRSGERVTAEEIRYMADELETQLGGLYSTLAHDLQLPVVQASAGRLQKRGKMPKMPKEFVTPTIVTGAEALGRGNDVQRLRNFAALMTETFGPEETVKRINVEEFATRSAAGMSIEPKGLVRTQDEVDEEEDAQAGAAMMGAAAQTAMEQGATEEAAPPQ